MRKFVNYLFLIVGLVLISLVISDFIYTQIYIKSSPRNKLQYLLKKQPENYDVVFLGSSRVENHINTSMFDTLSNLKTLNLGVQGAGLNDNLLLLKLLIEKNRVKNLVLQLDNNIEGTEPSNISNAEALPFIRSNKIVKLHEENYLNNFETKMYIPFYRYMIYDPKIGFRELFMSVIGKNPRIALEDGFSPKFGTINKKGKYALPNTRPPRKNFILDKIRAICNEKNIKLFLFTAPYCENLGNPEYIDFLKMYYPNLINLSKGFSNDLFYDCGHLNAKGADTLTINLYSILANQLQ